MRERTFFEGKSVDCWALLSFTSEREFDQKASRFNHNRERLFSIMHQI